MQYRAFGKTGIEVSEVGFGAWAIGGPARLGNTEVGWGEVDDKQSLKVLEKAFDLGINFFDTADVYGNGHSEELIGRVFEKKRDKVLICTKYGNKTNEQGKWVKDFCPVYARECLTNSLRRLRTDYVDFFLIHTPVAHLNIHDLADSAMELERLKDEGKIRFWGISINPVSHGLDVIQNDWGSAIQVVFNVLQQEPEGELFPAALQSGIGIIVRVPLASGLLTGKFKKGHTFPDNDHRSHTLPPEKLFAALNKVEKLHSIATERGITMAQLSLLYILSF
ncbi:MAG: aldo/keto reductase, partial [Spirochaetaceae bacterium]|nr:aldo/keto reductase [Spirochaetaceae bacterium]